MAHLMFDEIDEYKNILQSFDTMFVMLTTNNFPDAMLKTFPIYSKFTIIFFLSYMFITYIVLIALLKALYYSNYIDIDKEKIIDFLNSIVGKNIFNPNKESTNNNNKLVFSSSFRNSFNYKGGSFDSNNLNFNPNKNKEIIDSTDLDLNKSGDGGEFFSPNFSRGETNFGNYFNNNNSHNNNNNNKTEDNIFNKSSFINNESIMDNTFILHNEDKEDLLENLEKIIINLSLTKKETKIIKRIINFSSNNDDYFNEVGKLMPVTKNNLNDSSINGKSFIAEFENENGENNNNNNIDFKKIEKIKRNKEIKKFLLLEDNEIIKQSKFLKLSGKKTVEMAVNFLNITAIGFYIAYNKEDKELIFLICLVHVFFNIYFIVEFREYLRFFKIKEMWKKYKLRSFFVLINIIGFVVNVLVFVLKLAYYFSILDESFESGTFYTNLIQVNEGIVILRALRIIFLLIKFKEFYAIFTTINNIKNLFSSVLFTLLSFCFIFVTISMILFGGKIKNDRYVNNPNIPENYHNLNFNDYTSGFLFCVAMIVMNNMNILFDDLSLIYGRYMKFYFSIFFFLGIILIVNITQTIILEMYLSIKDTLGKLNRNNNSINNNNTKN